MPVSRQQLKALIEAYPTSERVCWTPGQIKRAFRAYVQGNWHDVSLLFDSMFEDDTFPGTLETRVDATLKSEFSLKVKGSKVKLNRRDQNAEDLFCVMAPDDELSEFLSQWIMVGVGLGTLDWDTSGPVWVPKLRVLDTDYLNYDTYRKVWTFQAKDGEHIVTPGDGKWVMLTSGQTGWRHGLIRSLGQLWLQKQLTYCDWNRYNVKHGLPIVKAKVPVNADGPEKDRFLDDLEDLESEGIVGLPQDADGKGYDIELMEAKDNSWASFQANIDRADRKFQVALLGGNLGQEVASTGANRAAAQTHASNVERSKAKNDAKALGRCLQQQILAPFYALNYGESTLPPPFPYWDVAPEEDARAWADAQVKFGQVLNSIKAAGYSIENLNEMAGEYGLVLTERKPEDGPTGPTGDSPQPPSESDEAQP